MENYSGSMGSPTKSPEDVTTLEIEDICLSDSKVYLFLLSSLLLFIMALVIAFIYEMVFLYLRSKNKRKSETNSNKKIQKFKQKIDNLVSDQSESGKYLQSIVLLMSGFSFIDFLIDSYLKFDGTYTRIEECQLFFDNPIAIIDFILNLFFLFYFFIRLISATNKFWFLFEIYSIVDFITIPPAFVALFLDRSWIGFKFLRVVMFWYITNLLIKFDRIKTSFVLIFIKLITGFTIFLLISSGFIFTLENSGTPYHTLSYKQSVYYFVLFILPFEGNPHLIRTEYGFLFIVILIISLFISLLWVSAKLFHTNPLMTQQYYKPFRSGTQKFLIISGYLSKSCLKQILDDFDWNNINKNKNKNIDIVLMDTTVPEFDETTSFLLKRVKYFCGSVLNQKDLNDLQAHKADRFILLAKKHTKDTDSEDANNIMRVISLKTYSKQIPISVQLIRSQNKYYLNSIPDWNPNKGDKVLCISELRMRLIGQSCLAPGLNTLLYNLISCDSYKLIKPDSDVERDYIRGTKAQIFVQNLSPAFEDMTFSQTAEICFTKFKSILFAIQTNESQQIVINPKPDFKLDKLTRAFFMAKNRDSVKRIFWYCLNCHNDITDIKKIGKCKCLRVEDIVKQRYIQQMGFDTPDKDKTEKINLLQLTSDPIEKSQDLRDSDEKKSEKKDKDKNKLKMDQKDIERKYSTSSSSSSDITVESNKQIEEFCCECNYDSSASFHYCPIKSIDDCILEKDSQLLNGLTDHVIVGIFSDKESPLIGLKNLVLTLRTSNIPFDELRPVLIVGNVEFIRREWSELENIPEVYVFNGSLLCGDHLDAINLIVCNNCVILSTNLSNHECIELTDKFSILADINVKTFTFDDSKLQLLSKNFNERISIETKPPIRLRRKGSVYCVNIPIITEIESKESLKKLMDSSREGNQNIDQKLNKWFASGCVSINTFIDSLTSLDYFEPEIIKLIETLVSGGLSTELDSILCQTQCLKWKTLSAQTLRNRDRSRITQISLRGPFNQYNQAKYGQLFTEALNTYGILCFGVYRLLDDSESNTGPDIRYVIASPSKNFQLKPNDLIFAFIQCNTKI